MKPVCRTTLLPTLLSTLLYLCGCSDQPAKPPVPVEPAAPTRTKEPKTDSDLLPTPDGRAYKHRPSQTTFRLPPAHSWKSSPPLTVRGLSSLELKQGDNVSVWVSWSKIETELVQVVSSELKGFRERFEDENVGLLEQMTAGDNVGWKVELNANADGDLSQRGRVFWFSTTSPDNTRWKIKLLATFPKDFDTTAIDRMPTQFEWPEREYGPRPQ